MTNRENISFYSLLPDNPLVEDGIHCTDNHIIGISHDSGLIAMAPGKPDTEESAAYKSIEILLDDMQSNLTLSAIQSSKSPADELAKQCMQESLDNINEYLYARINSSHDLPQDATTRLSAIQYLDGYISYIVMGDTRCLLVKQGDIGDLPATAKLTPHLLGEKPFFEGLVNTVAVSQGDMLIMGTAIGIDEIGLDYLHTTVSRFPQALDMALRQINTRSARNGSDRAPTIIIGRIEQEISSKRSWINKLRQK